MELEEDEEGILGEKKKKEKWIGAQLSHMCRCRYEAGFLRKDSQVVPLPATKKFQVRYEKWHCFADFIWNYSYTPSSFYKEIYS